jgi:hypothetical protein
MFWTERCKETIIIFQPPKNGDGGGGINRFLRAYFFTP